MSLEIPGQIIRIDGRLAVADFWGTRKEVRLDALTEAVSPGDYIIDLAGFAVHRIDEEDVYDTLAMVETVLADAGEEPFERLTNELESSDELDPWVARS